MPSHKKKKNNNRSVGGESRENSNNPTNNTEQSVKIANNQPSNDQHLVENTNNQCNDKQLINFSGELTIRQQIPCVSIDEYRKLELENAKLKLEIEHLRIKDLTLTSEITKRDQTIEDLKQENRVLQIQLTELKTKLAEQDLKITQLENKNNRFDALVKLHECNSLVNQNFKMEYRRWFNKMKHDNSVPNIGDLISDPPNDINDPEEYAFWVKFVNKYPKTDDPRFRKLYYYISNQRSIYGAHLDVSDMNQIEFDQLAKIAFADYDTNRTLYDEYRDWLFLFPKLN